MKRLRLAGLLVATGTLLISTIAGSADAAPKVTAASYVRMPNLIGQVDGQLRWQLGSHGYKFSVASTRSYPGYNTKLSCVMSGRNYVVKQSPASGITVLNSSSTWVTVWVYCG